jgi:hypothetical protein
MVQKATYTATFNGLQAELQRYVEDDTTEFTTDLENIIARGQDKVVLDLDLDIFKTVETGALTISDSAFTKPTAAVMVRWIFVPALGTYIERRSLELCKMFNIGAPGEPRFYGEVDETTLYVAPTPDQAYAVEIGILRRVEALASGNQTNWITDNVPELLLLACLIESEEYLIDEGARVATFKAEYGEKLALAQRQFSGLQRMDEVRRAAPPAKPAA